jgi:heme/copper-type cytochrome/quinol oxidase subunit 1
MGIVAEVIANNTRKPLWGYRSMVWAATFLGFMSFIVWAHHMFMTGMGTTISAFFQTTTMIISIPSVIILSALFLSLWGGSIRFTTPMLFALAFLPMFGIGGMQYEHAKAVAAATNPFMSRAAIGLLLFQLPFIVNFFWNVMMAALGKKNVNSNPWEATTLEWVATTSPPLGHGNFEILPVVTRGPYEYSVPGSEIDWIPQHAPLAEPSPTGGGMLPHTAVAQKES